MFTKWSDDDHNLNEIEFVETAITILKPCLEESLGRSTIYWKKTVHFKEKVFQNLLDLINISIIEINWSLKNLLGPVHGPSRVDSHCPHFGL